MNTERVQRENESLMTTGGENRRGISLLAADGASRAERAGHLSDGDFWIGKDGDDH